jgi:hypothetical protein
MIRMEVGEIQVGHARTAKCAVGWVQEDRPKRVIDHHPELAEITYNERLRQLWERAIVVDVRCSGWR